MYKPGEPPPETPSYIGRKKHKYCVSTTLTIQYSADVEAETEEAAKADVEYLARREGDVIDTQTHVEEL